MTRARSGGRSAQAMASGLGAHWPGGAASGGDRSRRRHRTLVSPLEVRSTGGARWCSSRSRVHLWRSRDRGSRQLRPPGLHAPRRYAGTAPPGFDPPPRCDPERANVPDPALVTSVALGCMEGAKCDER